MKQRVKHNNRRKAAFGIDDAIFALITLAATAASTGITVSEANRRQKESNRLALINSNNENSITAQTNEQQALNYDQTNEIETMKTNSLKTINSQTTDFKCGGKHRMKRAGGTVTSNISKLGLYI